MPALRLNGVFSNIITQTTNSRFSHFVICKLVCVLLAPQYQIGLNKTVSLVERIVYGMRGTWQAICLILVILEKKGDQGEGHVIGSVRLYNEKMLE